MSGCRWRRLDIDYTVEKKLNAREIGKWGIRKIILKIKPPWHQLFRLYTIVSWYSVVSISLVVFNIQFLKVENWKENYGNFGVIMKKMTTRQLLISIFLALYDQSILDSIVCFVSLKRYTINTYLIIDHCIFTDRLLMVGIYAGCLSPD